MAMSTAATVTSPDGFPTEREMVELAERWRPYRSLAVSYLFASEFEEGT